MSYEVDNPYDPSSSDQTPETLPLDEVIKLAIEKQLLETHVAMPGEVAQVRGNQLVDVQPHLKRKYVLGGAVLALPIIQNVPVQLLAGKTWWFKGPIAVGDVGTIIFSERSLDAWKTSGGLTDPGDPRHHHMSDAIFIPGLASKASQVQGSATSMVIHNGQAEIQMTPDGKFKVTNGTNELLDLLDQTLQAILDATTNTIFGPLPVNNLATFAMIKAKLDTLKG